MDQATLIVNLGVFVATAAAAAVAWWQAIVASRQRGEAEAAAERAAAAQESAAGSLAKMASAQEAMALASRKAAWGVPKPLGSGRWAIRNTSGHRMTLLGIEVNPEAASELLAVEANLPMEIASGELLHFAAESRLSLHINSFTLVWAFVEGDSTVRRSPRTLT